MKKFEASALKGLAYSASALAMVVAAPALAQDADVDCDNLDPSLPVPAECEADITGADGTTGGDAGIVVTGSRIVRDTYSSISPLQVLTTESEQDAGLFDPTSILQRSESAAGVQIDATFQGFVLDNGPGSTTLDLRGLGADRTLLLINGRRLAPAGVEGAPTAPSLNLLPSTLIERYDLLLDGASSVYGSDAVAGVGNVILKKDFDGLELTAFGNINPMGGGDDYTVGGAWGFNADRGFFGIGAEYDYRDSIRLSDRDFFRGCTTNLDITTTGEIRRTTIDDQAFALADSNGLITTSTSECIQDGFNGRIIVPFNRLGSVYYDERTYYGGALVGNSGIPGFSESNFGGPIDADGDGVRDLDFLNDYNLNGANPEQTFLSQQKRFNVLAYGEYTFPGAANITPYFEAMYTRAEVFGENEFFAQIFPYVPDDNAFNPCNTAVTGVDCRSSLVIPGAAQGGIGAQPVRPVFAIEGDRNNTDITQEQYRGVFGIRGDLPFISPSWSFDTSFVYSYADGRSNVRGIREDKLAFALGIDPTMDFDGDGIFDNDGDGIADDYDSGQIVTNNALLQSIFGYPAAITPCDASALANPNAALADLTQGCVPVNLFAPSVLNSAQGTFATQAETDYLFGDRSFKTTYEQIVFNAFVTGDLFDLPAGPVGAVLGIEYRRDEINSIANDVASNGLFFGFFADSGAVGSKEIKEAFAEIDIPLQAGKPWVEELSLNLSGRVTDEEFYGTNFTYSIKGGWRPIEPLLLKMSYGTSFRAPNLRENFLGRQTGFVTLRDPCAVPDLAFDDVNGVYDPTGETRNQTTLDNCVREGRDPTLVGLLPDPLTGQSLPPVQNPSVQRVRGGSLDIDPETSRSITAGFAFEDTFGDGWDVALGMNYYDIKVKDSIISPNAQFILNDCYEREDGQRSSFCDRITVSNTGRLLVSDIFAGFINLNEESVRGLDFNARFGKELPMFGTLVDWNLNVRANHLLERSTLFINENGDRIRDRDEGEVGLQRWTGRATLSADIDKFRVSWTTRYIGGFDQDPDNIDDFSDVFGYDQNGNFIGQVGSTCLGGGSRDLNDVPDGIVPGDGVYCRPVGFADEQFLHTASIRYTDPRYEIVLGVSNVFDTAPPQVSPFAAGITDISNTVLGAGYDYNGREFFASVNVKF